MNKKQKRLLREEAILSRLDEFGYATRKQLQIAEGLSGDRNALRILREMERDKLIASVRREYKVFYVSNKGKERIGSTSDVRSPSGNIDHTLMRNDLYIMLGMPDDWRVEVPVKYSEGKIECDALYTDRSEFHFVEVDNAQTMRNNTDKLQRYAVLSKDFFRQYNHTPTVVFYTVTPLRERKLREYAERVGVKIIVYVKEDAP